MKAEMVLLPQPRKVRFLQGSHKPGKNGLILLAEPNSAQLLPTGKIVQDVLAGTGARIAITAAGGAGVLVTVAVDPAVIAHPQGYRLEIMPRGIRIQAHDLAGAFYAAMTLRQLVRQAASGGVLPCLRIDDWPDFPSRGVMLDISRSKVPTMATLYAVIDMLSEWKINQFQLYTEHTFAYRNHREVWEEAYPIYVDRAPKYPVPPAPREGASPMTGEEILALDAYCRARHVELVPNQNSFGHLTRWLTHPRYRPLAETPGGFDTPWGHNNEPFSLCPLDPGSIALVGELFEELLPHFTSRQINVGADETFDIGQGRSKDACAKQGGGRVYLDFLLKIHALARKHGRTMQFWGDIILKHPELISELPGDSIPLVWGYEADHPFKKQCAAFAKAGLTFHVCPGTSAWNTIGGRTENAIGNLRNAAENGLRYGATGFLNTDWGDGGHWHSLPVSFLGYGYGAAVSWACRANRDLPMPRALDLHAFYDRAGVMGQLACDLGNVYQVTRNFIGNGTNLFLLLLVPDCLVEGPVSKAKAVHLKKAEARIEAIMARLPRARMARGDAALIAQEFQHAAGLMRHACRSAVARLKGNDRKVERIPATARRVLAADLDRLCAEHRKVWLARNRPGGLNDSLWRLRWLAMRYRA